MIKIAIPENNLIICDEFERMLIKFPLSKETDKVQVIAHKGKFHIAYLTDGRTRVNQTCFDLEIRENICGILGFFIKDEQKGKGYGKSLYLIVEEIAKYFRCDRIQTSPSGQGLSFWPYMGFDRKCDIGIEKML